jgi:hypothetical protein
LNISSENQCKINAKIIVKKNIRRVGREMEIEVKVTVRRKTKSRTCTRWRRGRKKRFASAIKLKEIGNG